jgi:hypothetical protein
MLVLLLKKLRKRRLVFLLDTSKLKMVELDLIAFTIQN